MSRARKIVLLFVWLVLATHLYAFIWSNNLDIFPQLPEEVGTWIVMLTGTNNTEDVENVTLYYILIVSFVVVAAATAIIVLGDWALRKIRNR